MSLLMARYLLPLLGCVLMLAGLAGVVHKAKEAGRAEVRAEWSAERMQLAEAARQAEAKNRRERELERERIEKERQDHATKLARANAAAAGARSELDRLRVAIQTLTPRGGGVPEAGPAAPRAGDPGAAAELLSECAGAHQELAAEADRLAIQLAALLALVPR
jgi:hypothetical protein